jgi:hypothetical protein
MTEDELIEKMAMAISGAAAMRDFERALADIRRHGLPVAVLRARPVVNDLNDMVKPRRG